MKRHVEAFILSVPLCLALSCSARAQSVEGPITPAPGMPVQQAPPQAKMKVQVSLVNTPVTVRNSKGEMVHDLDARDFRITDNGVPQTITHFDLGGDPISLAVVLETSSRIEPMLPQMRKSGILITQTVMGPTGEGALIGVNDSVEKLLDFTSNADAIEGKMAGLEAGGSGLKLYDAMSLGVEMLTGRPQATRETPGRRRVMLVISEAADTGSESKLGEVLRRAQVANVTIYSVGLSTTRAELQPKNTAPQITPPGTVSGVPFPGSAPTPDNMAARYGSGNLMEAIIWAVSHVKDQLKANPLEIATAGTGGAHIATMKDRSMENAIDEIGGELHAQYSISYTPSPANGPGFHEIKVTLDQKGLKVRARPGYYLPESGS